VIERPVIERPSCRSASRFEHIPDVAEPLLELQRQLRREEPRPRSPGTPRAKNLPLWQNSTLTVHGQRVREVTREPASREILSEQQRRVDFSDRA
jgi:hypothetical protein